MSLATQNEAPTPVAIQGFEGSYSDQAAAHLFGDGYHMIGCATFDDLFTHVVENGTVGVCPVENSIRGEVPEATKLLAKHAGNITITAELFLGIHHSLIGLEGADVDDLAAVHSHPVALAQCTQNIAALKGSPQATVEADTAGSLDVITQIGDKRHAAIASARALATRNGLSVLASGFEDDPTNTTRFLVLRAGAGQSQSVEGAGKATMLVSHAMPERTLPTVLDLSQLSDSGLTVTRLHPVTRAGRPFDPAYFMDVAGPDLSRLRRKVVQARLTGASVVTLGTYAPGETI